MGAHLIIMPDEKCHSEYTYKRKNVKRCTTAKINMAKAVQCLIKNREERHQRQAVLKEEKMVLEAWTLGTANGSSWL
jgi:hypothetical protein